MADKESSVRIICGAPELVEREVNVLLENYAPAMWNIQTCDGKPLVTCILVHERELRKAQIAAMRNAAPMTMGPRQ